MRPRHLAAFVRAIVLAGVAGAALVAPALGQPAQQAVDELFLDLQQLQDANLGIARQMSDIQRRAAAVLEAAQAEGALSDPAQEAVLTALISNALTLASIVLAPIATQDVAAGEVFAGLLEDNMRFTAKAEPLFRADVTLARAIEQYAVMQVQTQDLGLALRNGWNRYGDAVAGAEAAGLLPTGGFDPAARNWTITLPDVDAALAVLPEPSEATAAASDERLAPETSILDQPAFDAEPAADVAAAAEQEAERLAASQPDVAPPVAAALASEAASVAATAKPLPTGEALALVDPDTVAAAPVEPAAWMVMIGDNARAVAKAPNANSATASQIRGLQIGCHPNGTLRYIFETDREVGEYLVFANKEDSAKIRASANIVSGSEAIHMSDVLRLAFEWASGTAAADAHIMVAAGDDPGAVAYFPVSGYLEARGRVLDGCVPWEEADGATATGAIVDSAVGPEPEAADTGAPEPAIAAPETVAPMPRPRPAGRMLVDLMNAG